MGFARAVWVSAVVLLGGCGHAPPPRISAAREVKPPGRVDRMYRGTPWYLQPPSSEALPEGVYLDEVPVAGPAWHPGADLLDRIRVRLARVDQAAVALRNGKGPADVVEDVDAIAELRDAAQAVARLVKVRPDVQAEAEELVKVAEELRAASAVRREKLLNRVEELTDLIRLQLSTTS